MAVGRNSADAAFDALGETGGEKGHTLTEAEMPSHSHYINSAGTHTHQVYGINSRVSGTWNGFVGSASCTQSSNNNALAAGEHIHTANNTGGGSAHNNMPPYTVLNYIIKT